MCLFMWMLIKATQTLQQFIQPMDYPFQFYVCLSFSESGKNDRRWFDGPDGPIGQSSRTPG